MGEKNFEQKFSTTNWFNWQTESSTENGTDKFLSKWQTKVAQCPTNEERNSSKNLLGHVVSSCEKLADCFLTKKKPLILCSIFEEREKKHKQKLCQNKVITPNWSFGLVECSFVKLTGKVSKTTDKISLNVQK